MCAFSFRIGTRVYFFKAKVQQDGKGFFTQVGFDMLELRRRRHVRFDVPTNFEHECFVITSLNKSAKVPANILNFSESGAKLMVAADLVLYQKGNGIILSLKVGKRATFLVGCQIRFVSRKPKENPELGVEFVNLTEIKKSRILNVCEDLTRLLVQANKKKRLS
jgi:c-di-GMP-binding flagellar brake protein YcgR